MATLKSIAEAAPQFRKTPASMRWWLRQEDCPIPIVHVGRKVFVAQESIDAFFDDALKGAA